jgi:hypothetical protein
MPQFRVPQQLKEVDMKRKLFIGLLVAAALLFVSFGAFLSDSSAWTHDNSSQATKQQAIPEPVIDGSKNPNLIPDVVAHEVLLRQLSTGDDGEDKDWKIRNSYLKWAGFDEVQSAALKFAAADFKKQIAALDQQVATIKNEKWPRPDKATMDQLTLIEGQKENLIREIVDNLFQQLTFHNPDVVRTHLHARIKFQTKGFIPGLPPTAPKRVGWLEKIFREPFVTTAYAFQYGGGSCSGQQYVTSSTWVDYVADAVFTSAVVTANYNSCGHGYTLSTSLSHNGESASGSNYVSMGLDPGGSAPRRDGFFGSSTTSYSYCSHSGTTHPSGGGGSSTTASPTVKLNNFRPSNDNVADNQPIELIAEVKASSSVTGNVTLQFDVESNIGGVVLAGVPRTKTEALSGSSVNVEIGVAPGGGRKGPVKFEVGLTSVPSPAIVSSGPLTTEVCFGPKVSGTCPVTP